MSRKSENEDSQNLRAFLGKIDLDQIEGEEEQDNDLPDNMPFIWGGDETETTYSPEIILEALKLAGYSKFAEQEWAGEYAADNFFIADTPQSLSLANEGKKLIPAQQYYLRKM